MHLTIPSPQSKLKISWKIHARNLYFSQIAYYSTAHTSDAVYIIGGYYTDKIVAEFKDNQWSSLQNLNQGRYSQGSITVGDETMVIGGMNESEA